MLGGKVAAENQVDDEIAKDFSMVANLKPETLAGVQVPKLITIDLDTVTVLPLRKEMDIALPALPPFKPSHSPLYPQKTPWLLENAKDLHLHNPRLRHR